MLWVLAAVQQGTEFRVHVLNSMANWPHAASKCSASQEIHHLLCNWKVHYHVHNSLPLKPVLSQMDPVHLFKICFNIIQPFKCIYPDDIFPLVFSDQNLYAFLISPNMCYGSYARPSHNLRFEHPDKICEEYKLWSSSVRSTVSSFIIYFPLSSSIPLALCPQHSCCSIFLILNCRFRSNGSVKHRLWVFLFTVRKWSVS